MPSAEVHMGSSWRSFLLPLQGPNSGESVSRVDAKVVHSGVHGPVGLATKSFLQLPGLMELGKMGWLWPPVLCAKLCRISPSGVSTTCPGVPEPHFLTPGGVKMGHWMLPAEVMRCANVGPWVK